MRTAEQVAEEMAAEMRRRFGFRTDNELVRLWLARCIMEARHELAIDMGEPDRPPHTRTDALARFQ